VAAGGSGGFAHDVETDETVVVGELGRVGGLGVGFVGFHFWGGLALSIQKL